MLFSIRNQFLRTKFTLFAWCAVAAFMLCISCIELTIIICVSRYYCCRCRCVDFFSLSHLFVYSLQCGYIQHLIWTVSLSIRCLCVGSNFFVLHRSVHQNQYQAILFRGLNVLTRRVYGVWFCSYAVYVAMQCDYYCVQLEPSKWSFAYLSSYLMEFSWSLLLPIWFHFIYSLRFISIRILFTHTHISFSLF